MDRKVVMFDYLVVTWMADSKAEAVYPHFYAKVHNGVPVHLRGYRGRVKDRLFFGRSEERYMLQATGSKAHELMSQYDFRAFNSYSFARVDLQVTIDVKNADHIILHTRPSGLYKSTITYSLNEPGATLYVGSPASRVRLRVYNKTAESGIRPDEEHDYMRVELQLRDQYADRAAIYYYSDQVEQFFRTYIAKMLDTFITDIVTRYIGEPGPALQPLEESESDWIARRYAWLQFSVTPAIMKLALADPDGVARFLRVLIDKLDIDVL